MGKGKALGKEKKRRKRRKKTKEKRKEAAEDVLVATLVRLKMALNRKDKAIWALPHNKNNTMLPMMLWRKEET